MSYCKYCKIWQECPPKLVRMEEIEVTPSRKETISLRYCSKVRKFQRSADTACPQIEIAKTFHCNLLGERVSVIVCLYRQGFLQRKPEKFKSYSQCPCFEGISEVRELTRGRNLLLLHGYIKKQDVNLPRRKKDGQSVKSMDGI